MQDGKGFMDPVKREEEELAELEAFLKEQGVMAEKATEEPPAAQEPTGEPVANQEEPPQAAVEPSATKAQPQAEQQTTTPEDENSETYKQRWLSLQGMYRSETNRLRGEVARLNSIIEQLQSSQPAKQDAQDYDNGLAPGDEGYRSRLVTDAMRNSRAYKVMAEKYGEDYAELHYEGIAEAQQASAPQVQEQVERANQTAQELRELEVQRLLSTQVPEWQALNVDPNFIQWTQTNHAPFSGGRTYNEVLNAAYMSGDVLGCAEVFTSFMKLQQQTNVAAQTQTPNRTQTPPNTPDHLVTPQGVNTSTPAPQSQQKAPLVIDEKYINNFYREVERGAYAGREAEMRQVEAEILKVLQGGM